MKFKQNLIFLWSWFKETHIHLFSKDNCPLMAAAISSYAILSLIPLFLLLISLLGFVLHSSEKTSSSAYYLLVKTFQISCLTIQRCGSHIRMTVIELHRFSFCRARIISP
jgi:hypothetical protein